jgi:predicted nucleotidyltransferase
MDFKIEENTHYLVLAGSHAYNCNTIFSDFDIRGWAVPTKEYFFSLHKNFEQTDTPYTYEKLPMYWRDALTESLRNNDNRLPVAGEKIDCVVYALKKFMQLVTDCNPNIIDLLFVDESDVLVQTRFGKLLRENANLFLSARAKYSFSGYAIAQLKRINSHRRWLLDPPKKKPLRSDFGLPEQPLASRDQMQAAEGLITKQVRLWMLAEAEVDKSIVSLLQEDIKTLIASILENKNAENEIEKAAGRTLGISDNFIELIQLEKKYRQALMHYNQYQNWLTTRNPKRAELEKQYGYDTKYACQLVRLLLESEEILTKGTLTIKDKTRGSLLQAVRLGFWSYEQLIDWTSKQMDALDTAYNATTCAVPYKPDIEKIDILYQSIIKEIIDTQTPTTNAYYYVEYG